MAASHLPFLQTHYPSQLPPPFHLLLPPLITHPNQSGPICLVLIFKLTAFVRPFGHNHICCKYPVIDDLSKDLSVLVVPAKCHNSACLGIKPHFVPCDRIDERFDHFEEDVHKPRYIGN